MLVVVVVAILAQVRTGRCLLPCLRRALIDPRPANMDASCIIASLHGRLLRGIAELQGVHYQGLRAAASHLRREGRVSNRTAKRLGVVDIAFSVSRHITNVSAEDFFDEVMKEAQTKQPDSSAAKPCASIMNTLVAFEEDLAKLVHG